MSIFAIAGIALVVGATVGVFALALVQVTRDELRPARLGDWTLDEVKLYCSQRKHCTDCHFWIRDHCDVTDADPRHWAADMLARETSNERD